MAATKNDRPDILKVFLDNIEIGNVSELVELAVELKLKRCLDWFYDNLMFTEEVLEYMAVICIKEEYFHMFEQALNYGLSLKMRFKGGLSLLGKAVEMDSCSFVNYLVIAHGFDVNAMEKRSDLSDGTTMVSTCVAFARSAEMFKMLYGLGANLNAHIEIQNTKDEVTLTTNIINMVASKNEYAACKALMDLGANPDTHDSFGATARAMMEASDELYS